MQPLCMEWLNSPTLNSCLGRPRRHYSLATCVAQEVPGTDDYAATERQGSFLSPIAFYLRPLAGAHFLQTKQT